MTTMMDLNQRTGEWQTEQRPGKRLSGDQIEADRAKRYDHAVSTLREVAAAMKRLEELEPERQQHLTAKDAVAGECEQVCQPLRAKLREIETELAGKPISRKLLL